jgi:hypothetical protein
MDAAWEGHQSQALLFLNIGLIAALLAAVLALVGAVRGGRPALPGDA